MGKVKHEFVPIGRVASRLKVTRETVRLWIDAGRGGRRLRAVKVADRWVTTWAWVREFHS